MAAGSLIVAAMLACAGLGLALGSVIGVAVPLGIAGLFVGVFAGIALVIARFRDL
jgi:hypothetical protein